MTWGALAPLVAGAMGGPELVVVLLIVALLFGPDRIPELAKSTGQAMGEFRKGKLAAERKQGEADREGAVDREQETESDVTDS